MCKQRDRCRGRASCQGWGLYKVAISAPHPRLLVPRPRSPLRPAWSPEAGAQMGPRGSWLCTCVPAARRLNLSSQLLPGSPFKMRTPWGSRAPIPCHAPAAGALSPRRALRVRDQGTSGLSEPSCDRGADQGRCLWRGHCWHPLCLWAAALASEGQLDTLLGTISLSAPQAATLARRADCLFRPAWGHTELQTVQAVRAPLSPCDN